MQCDPAIRSISLASTILCAGFALGSTASAQGASLTERDSAGEERLLRRPMTLDGLVLGPDGVPAAGAVVVSDALPEASAAPSVVVVAATEPATQPSAAPATA